MVQKNVEKAKRKAEREKVGTFTGFRPSVIDHKKIYSRKRKHKKDYDE